jgi:hypothetical protein
MRDFGCTASAWDGSCMGGSVAEGPADAVGVLGPSVTCDTNNKSILVAESAAWRQHMP